ncbi:MAG: nitronate monooxygenase [Flavobacteriales bacterium]|nr:nitronate monooxygenase [Flavobacteriales bacterium]
MNRVSELFGIKYPIIQGGMVWCSGWKLASAVSNSGALGLIGSGSMYPNVLREHIIKCKNATNKPFGVNLPLLYPDIDEHISIIIKEKIKIVFTSAGSPKKYTSILKKEGVKVAHVVSSLKFAEKSKEAGVDAIVAEGFEAGGHNGKNQTTTLCLIPNVAKNIDLPVIAAGGIASGSSMLAAFSLGAEGVQIGTRFAVCRESSSHDRFKNYIFNSNEGDTDLTLKELTPVRLLKNDFYQKIKKAYSRHASKEELINILGRGRAKKGIFQGDLVEGELEIGQISAMVNKMESASEIIEDVISEFKFKKEKIQNTFF